MSNRPWRRLVVTLAGIALAIVSSIAGAHDFGGPTSASPPDPPKEPPPCENTDCCYKGPGGKSAEPISYWTGGETPAYVDLVVRGHYPVRIVRKYDSQSDFDTPLGYGWAFLHDQRLYEYPDGSVVIRHGCGTRDRYVYSGGAYVSPSGGTLGTLIEKPDGTFELTLLNGRRDFFDAQGRLTSTQDTAGNRHEYSYDSSGKLPLTGTSKAAVDPTAPMVVAFNYRLTRIDERGANGSLTGRYVTFQYNGTTGRLTTVTANDGRSVTYEHDVTGGLTKGNLIEANGLDGIVSTYDYTDPYDAHNLTSITEVAGRTPVVNTYDDQDRVIRQEEGTRKIEFNYQIPLTKTVVTKTIKDQNGLNPYTAVTTYDFASSGRITKITDALGHEKRYTYDSTNALRRREIWQKDGANLTLVQAVDWTYDTAGHKQTEIVVLDSGETITRTWSYDHDHVASVQVISSAAPTKLFRTEYTFYYGSDGRPTHVKDEKRRKDDGSFQATTHTYDSRNRLLTTTLPDGVKIVNEYTGDHVTKTYVEVGSAEIPQLTRRFDYDSEGVNTKQWDARNNLTEFAYDDQGRLTTVTNPLGEQRIYTYTGDLLTQVEVGHTVADGEGQVTKLNYDSRGRLTSVQRKDDSGTFQTYETYELDSEGRRLSVSDALSRKTRFSYDVLGRMISATDPLDKVSQSGFDAAGNLTSVKDALNREARFEYDDLNRRTAIIELGVTPNPRTEYGYDAVGNPTVVEDAEGHTTAYAYDALSRNTSITQPLTQAVQFAYDSRDRIDFMVTARGQKLDYAYETWGPLKEEKQFPTTSASTPDRTIGYAYDNDGNLTSTTDDGIQGGSIYTLTYDVMSRPYDETIKYLPGGDRVLNHRYDRFGNRKELTLQDGTSVTHTYSYNKLNQLSSASLVGASISRSHFANDDWQTVTLPNGVSRNYTYKTNGPVDTITVAGPSGQIAQYAYAYDNVLNVDTLTDPDGVHDYGYDGLDRLASATPPSGIGLPNESYTYDKVGNREDPGNSALYNYDNNNRITASPGLTYTFDADGSVATRSDGATFTHDPRSRLIQYSKSGTTSSYAHDSMGRRIKKTVGSTTTWYLWDGTRLLAEYSNSGTRQQRYAYLDDYAPTQVEDASGVYYLHADRLGTPRLLTSSSAQIVWRARYETFGRAVVEADPDGNSVSITLNLRLPGQYFDTESGLHYNYLRDYDPSTGRYIQADPIGQLGGINLYAYVAANPLSFVDPLGLTMFGGNGPGGVPSFSDIPPSDGPCLRAVMGRGGYIKRWIPCDGNPDKPYCPFSDDWDEALPDSGDEPPESWEDVLKKIAWDAATDPWNYIPFKGMMSVIGLAAKNAKLIEKIIKTRRAPGKDGGTSRHIIERYDGNTISVTHQVERDGVIIHQHQTFIGRSGGRRGFPDEWVEYPDVGP